MTSEYPRTYRSAKDYRTMCRFTAGLLLAVVIYGLLGRAMGWMHTRTSPEQTAIFTVGLLFIAVFMWFAAEGRATLHEDSIDVTSFGRTRTLRRGEILGRYFIPAGYRRLPKHVLVPADPNARPVKLPPSIEGDHVLQAWLHDIPMIHR